MISWQNGLISVTQSLVCPLHDTRSFPPSRIQRTTLLTTKTTNIHFIKREIKTSLAPLAPLCCQTNSTTNKNFSPLPPYLNIEKFELSHCPKILELSHLHHGYNYMYLLHTSHPNNKIMKSKENKKKIEQIVYPLFIFLI